MYNKNELISALKTLGIKNGDIVMVHSSLLGFGKLPDGVKNSSELAQFFYDALIEAIGGGELWNSNSSNI